MKFFAFLVALFLSTGSLAIEPIPSKIKLDLEKVRLGERLFHDTQLSGDGTISCATCHALDKGGTDRAMVSTGINGQKGPINSPTVYNSANNFVQFWDGRAKDLEEQALGPVENPKEMGESWENVVKKIKADGSYTRAFEKLYGGDVTKENIANAIAEFERSLITPDSAFDRYLKGDKSALSPLEVKGYALFEEKGCTSCHSGDYFGGDSYQQMPEEYFRDRGGLNEADFGRYNVTKDEDDRYFFKVPMLRNVAVTAPYFHDGNAKTLKEAVDIMAKYQLGITLTNSENKAIVEFLKSLTGQYKGEKLR